MLKAYLYPLLLSCLFTGMAGLLCHDLEGRGALRILCGSILALALLSPLSRLGDRPQEPMAPESQESIETQMDATVGAVALKKQAVEQALADYLARCYPSAAFDVSLILDATDPGAVQFRGALIRARGELSAQERESICNEMEGILGCDVRWEESDDAE